MNRGNAGYPHQAAPAELDRDRSGSIKRDAGDFGAGARRRNRVPFRAGTWPEGETVCDALQDQVEALLVDGVDPWTKAAGCHRVEDPVGSRF